MFLLFVLELIRIRIVREGSEYANAKSFLPEKKQTYNHVYNNDKL